MIAIGWQSGIELGVRLAPWIAAMRATPSTSPFLALPDCDQRQRLRPHRDRAGGAGDAVRLGLRRHVDHVRLARGIEVRERAHGGVGHGWNETGGNESQA